MEQFNYKMCWLHECYKSDFGISKCGNSSAVPLDVRTPPDCHSDCSLYTQCKRAFELAGLPNKMWNPPPTMIIQQEDVNAMAATKHIRQNVASFVKNGQNLWIFSVISGNGKTQRAVNIASTYILYNVTNQNYFDNMVRYVYIPKYVADGEIADKYGFESDFRKQFLSNLEDLYTADLVIWDEFGYGSDSRIESTTIRAIINERINNSRSNIFISGKSIPEVASIVGKNLCQRIQNSSVIIDFRGEDIRSNNIIDM